MPITWGTYQQSEGDRTIYVSSSSGSDSNDGLSESTPKASISAGMALMRQGNADWLLLKRGDTWSTGLGTYNQPMGGRSASQPWLISSYGTGARPKLVTGTNRGFFKFGNDRIDYFAVSGIEFDPTGREDDVGVTGFDILSPGSFVTIEDCLFGAYSVAIVLQGDTGEIEDVTVRGCHIRDTYLVGGHAHCLYAAKAPRLTIEYCTFLHGGWNESVEGADDSPQNHNIYIQPGCNDLVFRYNISAYASSHGIQARGATDEEGIHHNLFYRNPFGILLGTGGIEGGGSDPGRVLYGLCFRNAIVQGRNIGTAGRGRGIDCESLGADGEPGGVVCENAIIHNTEGTAPVPINFSTVGTGNFGVVVRDNVIYEWGGSVTFGGDTDELGACEFNDNIVVNTVDSAALVTISNAGAAGEVSFDGCTFWPGSAGAERYRIGSTSYNFTGWQGQVEDADCQEAPPSLPDPTRDLDAYAATLNEGWDADDFLDAAMAQSKDNWDDDLTGEAAAAWILAGFGIGEEPEPEPETPMLQSGASALGVMMGVL